MSVRYRRVAAAELRDHVEDLRKLEASIRYPLGDEGDFFTIDHGPDYHSFFSAMGEAHFMVALDERDRVVGSIAGVLREGAISSEPGRRWQTLYLGDYKVERAWRGRGVAHQLLVRGLVELLRTPRFQRWRLLFGAAMRGASGDVTRVGQRRKLHLVHLVRPWATLDVFFLDIDPLCDLDIEGAPGPETRAGLLLSPAAEEAHGLVSTAGRKDLRRSDGQAMPLWHMTRSPADWSPDLGTVLRDAARALRDQGAGGQICLALDTRLEGARAWMRGRGLVADAGCTVYGMRLPGGPRRSDVAWLHLATSDI